MGRAGGLGELNRPLAGPVLPAYLGGIPHRSRASSSTYAASVRRVYLIEETRLARRVVIKGRATGDGAGVSVERLESEIQLGARLRHTHIVPLPAAGAQGQDEAHDDISRNFRRSSQEPKAAG